jgi:aspartate-semialdehyde dehydrogenase
VLIDLTGALEDMPEAVLRGETSGTSAVFRSLTVHVIAHPASIAIATLLVAIAKHARILRSVVHVFEPASERGKKGLNELQQQTTAVLSFQKLKTEVFDTQAAFSMLARYGEEAVEPLEEIEQRIVRHLASLLAAQDPQDGAIPMPSLRAIQAPVFHGHSFSIWIEFVSDAGSKDVPQGEAGVAQLTGWLEQAGIDVRPDDPPANANIAGISGLSVGAIAADANQPRAFWLWMVADNLRLAADNALAVAQELL